MEIGLNVENQVFSRVAERHGVESSAFWNEIREALEAAHKDIIAFAEAEHLTAHANSIRVRFE